jgi:hypothetical protein
MTHLFATAVYALGLTSVFIALIEVTAFIHPHYLPLVH